MRQTTIRRKAGFATFYDKVLGINKTILMMALAQRFPFATAG
jgi:hypothetical protein